MRLLYLKNTTGLMAEKTISILSWAFCCMLWNQRRQTVQGYHYDKNERNDLQRKPTLMLRAFDEIFMGSGLARYLSKLNNIIRSKNNDGTKVPSDADGKPTGRRTNNALSQHKAESLLIRLWTVNKHLQQAESPV